MPIVPFSRPIPPVGGRCKPRLLVNENRIVLKIKIGKPLEYHYRHNDFAVIFLSRYLFERLEGQDLAYDVLNPPLPGRVT